MKVGTVLTLETETSTSKQIEKLRCKIIDINENYLFIDIPVNMHSHKTVFVGRGEKVKITYVDTDQAVYQFHSIVKASVKLRIHALKIPIPRKEFIKRIQRRQYVRIKTAVDVAIHCHEGDSTAFTTVTRDISGGGLSMIVPEQVNAVNLNKVELWISFRLNSGKHIYINTDAKVISVKVEKGITTASLKFESITQQDRQHLIYFCFEKQRDARKKEWM
ncbi:flagellar brake protein [Virgibacillus sp. W0181]|uniref:flagellar brake protein n=1 Tax=Virgibacillus sp. W0181 TaxID=3391581 RepID=UPI003F469F18